MGVATEGRQLYRDEWVPFYHKSEDEKEFPLRNRQVRATLTLAVFIWAYISSPGVIGSSES